MPALGQFMLACWQLSAPAAGEFVHGSLTCSSGSCPCVRLVRVQDGISQLPCEIRAHDPLIRLTPIFTYRQHCLKVLQDLQLMDKWFLERLYRGLGL